MLFRKDIEPRCLYCMRSRELNDEELLCPRKGVVSPGYHCFWFDYDPLKRTPAPLTVPDFSKFSDEDFEL